jgi:hypothetical protein
MKCLAFLFAVLFFCSAAIAGPIPLSRLSSFYPFSDTSVLTYFSVQVPATTSVGITFYIVQNSTRFFHDGLVAYASLSPNVSDTYYKWSSHASGQQELTFSEMIIPSFENESTVYFAVKPTFAGEQFLVVNPEAFENLASQVNMLPQSNRTIAQVQTSVSDYQRKWYYYFEGDFAENTVSFVVRADNCYPYSPYSLSSIKYYAPSDLNSSATTTLLSSACGALDVLDPSKTVSLRMPTAFQYDFWPRKEPIYLAVWQGSNMLKFQPTDQMFPVEITVARHYYRTDTNFAPFRVNSDLLIPLQTIGFGASYEIYYGKIDLMKSICGLTSKPAGIETAEAKLYDHIIEQTALENFYKGPDPETKYVAVVSKDNSGFQTLYCGVQIPSLLGQKMDYFTYTSWPTSAIAVSAILGIGFVIAVVLLLVVVLMRGKGYKTIQ